MVSGLLWGGSPVVEAEEPTEAGESPPAVEPEAAQEAPAPVEPNAAPGAEAGEPRAARPERIEEITITARKREEPLQRTPISITAFTGEDLHQQSLENISELSWQTPNLRMAPTPTSKNQAAASIRGQGAADPSPVIDPKVGIYIDGVYIPRINAAIFSFLDIERVEILRGPQGTLFGRNTIGGAINIIPKRPDGQFGGTAKFTVGSDQRRDFNGALGFPILGETLSARLAFQTLNHDPYASDNFGSDADLETARLLAGRASLRWLPTDTLDILIRYDRTWDHGGAVAQEVRADAGTLDGLVRIAHGAGGTGLLEDLGVTRTADFIDNDPRQTLLDFDPKDDTNIWGVDGTISWDVTPSLTVKSITAYRELDWSTRSDFDTTPLPLIHSSGGADNSSFSQELQLLGSAFDAKLDWVVGGFYFREDGSNALSFLVLPEVVPILCPPGASQVFDPESGTFRVAQGPCLFNNSFRGETHIDNSAWAPFAQGTYHLTDKWNLTAGLRYTAERREARFFNNSLITEPGKLPFACRFHIPELGGVDNDGDGKFNEDNVDGFDNDGDGKIDEDDVERCVLEGSERFSGWQYTGVVEYQATEDLMAYFKVSRGFNSGHFQPRAVLVEQGEPVDPETVTTYEFGTKGEWFDHRLRTNLALFYSANKDSVVENQIPNPINSIIPLTLAVNAARSYTVGAELEIQARPRPGLRLSAAIGAMHHEYKKFETDERLSQGARCPGGAKPPEFICDRSGSDPGLFPELSFGLSAQYSLPFMEMGDLSFRSDYFYTSQVYLGINNARYDKINRYGLLNIRISLLDEARNLEWAFFVKNVFDREYETGTIDLRPSANAFSNFGAPRTAGIELTYRFGAD